MGWIFKKEGGVNGSGEKGKNTDGRLGCCRRRNCNNDYRFCMGWMSFGKKLNGYG